MSALRVALVSLSAAVVTAACAAGQHAQTAEETPSVPGAGTQLGSISINNAVLHAPAGPAWQTGSDVPLTVYIANNGNAADTLTSVSSSAFPGGWSVVATSSVPTPAASSSVNPYTSSSAPAPTNGTPQTIGPQRAIGFSIQNTGVATATSVRTLLLKGLANASSPLYAGTEVKVTFTFAKAGRTTLDVPVEQTTNPSQQVLPTLSGPTPAE